MTSPSGTATFGSSTGSWTVRDTSFQISEDRTTATIPFPGVDEPMTMDADALQRLILDLALVRAQMEPRLPDRDLDHNAMVSVVPGLRWVMMVDPEVPTLMRLYLLHPGIGWIWISLCRTQAAEMAGAVKHLLPQLQRVQ